MATDRRESLASSRKGGDRPTESATQAETRSGRRTIANQQRLLSRLQRTVRHLEDAQALSHLGSWESVPDTNEVIWSRGMYHILGLALGDAKPSFDALLKVVHEDDRNRVQEELQRAYDLPGPFEMRLRIRRPDGEVRWVQAQGAAEGGDGGVTRLYGTLQDVTEQRQVERKFEMLLESAPDAMIIVEGSGTIVLVNAQAEKMFGYTRGELLGKSVEALIPESLGPRHITHREKYMEHPTPRPMGAGLELHARRRDGSTFPVEVSLSPIETEEGALVTAAVRDITERKKAAEADRIAFERLLEIEKLKEVDRFKTRVLNTASHELNTPITPLKLQLHMLRSGAFGELNPRQTKAVKILDRNVNRLSDLVGDILDVARLQGGDLKLQPDHMDVAKVARHAVESFEAAAREKVIQLRLVANEPAPVIADPQRISQVFYNLISNALKFSPNGSTILVVVRRDSESVTVQVQDEGPGLVPDQIRRLFQPFSQVHGQSPDAPPGTGLGLYICKGIVEQHGGTIHVQSTGQGEGSTFTFVIPLEPPPGSGTARGMA